jgi:uncharacterized protein involved in high-affinity Fe2+ transport
MKTVKLSAIAAAMIATVVLGGCATNDQKPSDAKSDSAAEESPGGAVEANKRPNECGLQEQAGPEFSFGPYDAAIAYFQPGQMGEPVEGSSMKMLDYGESQMHLELDLKANEYGTNWGYSADETPAGLDVSYEITDDKNAHVDSGMMMEMNAIDGSHYGTNLAKDTIKGPGKYKVTITIRPPKNYDLHSDYITGVPISEWYKPLTASSEWELTKKNLDIVAKNTLDPEAAMKPSAKCEKYPKKVFKDEASEKAMKAAEEAKPLESHAHMGH